MMRTPSIRNMVFTNIVVTPMEYPVPRFNTNGIDWIGDVPNTALVENMTPRDRKNSPARNVTILLYG